MKKQLVYNVVYERNGKIEKHNIFNNERLVADLRELREEYRKAYAELIESNYIVGPAFVDEAAIDVFKENYKETIFKEKLHRTLKYYYWARAEYEIILTDWPTMITKRDAEVVLAEFEDHECYRATINLPISLKVDVYDQIALNFDLFADYVWDNLDQL